MLSSKGEALSSLTMTKPGNLSANPAKIVWDGTDADNSNGTIAILTFSVPNNAGKYNITLSYDDGDIVNDALTPINPLTNDGYIQIESSFKTTVTIADQSVILEGKNANGKILVAFYTKTGNLLHLKTFDVTSIINADSVNNATKAKVMWLNGLNDMNPICPAQVIYITK